MDAFDLSLIVPCYNEQGNILPFYDLARKTLDGTGVRYELVFIDDGSADGTLEALKSLCERTGEDAPAGDRAVQVISFSRNFGKESAIYAGLQNARGACLGIIDADLQQDPAIALEMYRYLQDHSDCDMVAAYQEQRREGALLGWFKRVFYRTFNATADEISLPPNMSDFRVFRRIVADALLQMPEYLRFSKGLFSWVGFKMHAMPYTVRQRHEGKSTWSFPRLMKYAMDGILSFTTWPLKMAKWIVGISFVAAFLYLLYVLVVDYLIRGIAIPGYPTLVCLILLFGGLQLLVLGIMGEYMAREYLEVKRRPIYLTRERYDSLS